MGLCYQCRVLETSKRADPLVRNVRIVENSFARRKQGVHAELGRFKSKPFRKLGQ
jgi:hypothetical protein